jgi:hypothetical protein
MILYSFDPEKNKKVIAGEFIPFNYIFHKKVNHKHFMFIEGGYGISEDVVQQLIDLDCQRIEIQTKKRMLEFSFEELLKKPTKDYGHGKQRFLPVSGEIK